MTPFFVTGLHRSRSAWFANYLSHAKTFCFHDAWYGLDNIEDIDFLFRDFLHAGNSDPANLIFQDQLIELYPKAKWVVIDRDFNQCLASSVKAFPDFPESAMDDFRAKMQDLIRKVNPLVVDFEDIRGEGIKAIRKIEEVSEYLGCEAHLNRHRTRMLARMNVVIEPQFLRKAIQHLKEHPPEWLTNLQTA